jgi:hypothetical protein
MPLSVISGLSLDNSWSKQISGEKNPRISCVDSEGRWVEILEFSAGNAITQQATNSLLINFNDKSRATFITSWLGVPISH